MKIGYLSSARIPDDWAHVLQILQMCEAFAHAGAEVELIVPNRKRTLKEDPFVYGGVEKIFTIKKLPCIDLFPGTENAFFFYLRTVSFFISAKWYLLFDNDRVLYTRERIAALFFRNVFFEVHSTFTPTWFHRLLCRRIRGFIVLTSFIKKEYTDLGILPSTVCVAPDAVRLEQFSISESKEEVREKLGISKEMFVIGYVGTLKTMQMEKGVACVIEAMQTLPPHIQCYIVGGEEGDIAEYRTLAVKKGVSENIHFVGKVPHKEVPKYLRAFDVVVAPFPDFVHYRFFMSPLKIFEYMAADVPMIISDLPSLREVLDESTAVFIPPADSGALRAEILKLEIDPKWGEMIAHSAKALAEKSFTWDARARGILAFIADARRVI